MALSKVKAVMKIYNEEKSNDNYNLLKNRDELIETITLNANQNMVKYSCIPCGIHKIDSRRKFNQHLNTKEHFQTLKVMISALKPSEGPEPMTDETERSQCYTNEKQLEKIDETLRKHNCQIKRGSVVLDLTGTLGTPLEEYVHSKGGFFICNEFINNSRLAYFHYNILDKNSFNELKITT